MSETNTTTDTTATPSNGVNEAPKGVPTPKDPPKDPTPSKEPQKGGQKTVRKGETKPPEAPKPEAVRVETPKPEVPIAAAPTLEVPKAAQPQGLRLRVKVWTDPKTRKRYLMASAVIDPKSGAMAAYAMSDEDTKTVKLTPREWNALPFFYFQEDGPAPRAAARPVGVI